MNYVIIPLDSQVAPEREILAMSSTLQVLEALPDEYPALVTDWSDGLLAAALLCLETPVELEYEIYTNDLELIRDLLVCWELEAVSAKIMRLAQLPVPDVITKDTVQEWEDLNCELIKDAGSVENVLAVVRTWLVTAATGPQGQTQFIESAFKFLPMYQEHGIEMSESTVAFIEQLCVLMQLDDSVHRQIRGFLTVN